MPSGTLEGFGVEIDVGDTARTAAALATVDPGWVEVGIEVWIEGAVVGSAAVDDVELDTGAGPRVAVVAVGTSEAAWTVDAGVVGDACVTGTVVGGCCAAVVAGVGLALGGVPQSERFKELGGWPSIGGGGA